jgi:hypothetical protein
VATLASVERTAAAHEALERRVAELEARLETVPQGQWYSSQSKECARERTRGRCRKQRTLGLKAVGAWCGRWQGGLLSGGEQPVPAGGGGSGGSVGGVEWKEQVSQYGRGEMLGCMRTWQAQTQADTCRREGEPAGRREQDRASRTVAVANIGG